MHKFWVYSLGRSRVQSSMCMDGSKKKEFNQGFGERTMGGDINIIKMV